MHLHSSAAGNGYCSVTVGDVKMFVWIGNFPRKIQVLFAFLEKHQF